MAMTHQPFKRTTIRLEDEYFYRRDNRAPTVRARDRGYKRRHGRPARTGSVRGSVRHLLLRGKRVLNENAARWPTRTEV